MADAQACAERVARFRALMAERGIDAAIIRNNPDLRWLTGAERTFDHETAHTAVITQDAQWLHTDSRYYNTFQERLGADTPWQIDQCHQANEHVPVNDFIQWVEIIRQFIENGIPED